jgi:hypothetical protein
MEEGLSLSQREIIHFSVRMGKRIATQEQIFIHKEDIVDITMVQFTCNSMSYIITCSW